jgi:GWxTD domain-containing protein
MHRAAGGEKMRKFFTFSIVLLLFLAFVFVASIPADQEGKKEEKKDLPEKYKKWLEEDVIYIISQNEKAVFKSLQTDEMRENFIKTFWRRRDPTPGTPLNEFREEHYRRIRYANEHYFEGKAGWRTDRGRTYIMFGPPDFFETNPAGSRGFLFGPSSPTAEWPSEVWVYQHLPGVKTRLSRVEFTFINYYDAGSYQLALDPAIANALRNISIPSRYVGYGDMPEAAEGRALTPMERTEQARSLTAPNEMEKLYLLTEYTKSRGDVLEELERSSRLRKLKGFVESRESMSQLTFVTKENFMKGQGGQTYIPISIEVAARNLGFKKKKENYEGKVNFYIEVKDAQNDTVYQASDRLEMNLREETFQRRSSDYYQYRHGLNLDPGEYFLHLVVWDEFNSNVGYTDKKIFVPKFTGEGFALSEVILARNIRVLEEEPEEEEMEIRTEDLPGLQALKGIKLPEKITFGTKKKSDPFQFGNLAIIPNTLSEYRVNDELIFFYQIYHPTFDEKERKARIQIEHQIWRGDTFLTTIDKPQDVEIPLEQKAPGINSGARFHLANFAQGTYSLIIKVTDVFSNRMIERKIDFQIR